jgi:hypothetical protein
MTDLIACARESKKSVKQQRAVNTRATKTSLVTVVSTPRDSPRAAIPPKSQGDPAITIVWSSLVSICTVSRIVEPVTQRH